MKGNLNGQEPVVDYEDTEETLGVGECSAGESICVEGVWSECRSKETE